MCEEKNECQCEKNENLADLKKIIESFEEKNEKINELIKILSTINSEIFQINKEMKKEFIYQEIMNQKNELEDKNCKLSIDLNEKNREIKEKDEEIKEKNEKIQKKDEEIKEKNEKIQKKDEEIKEKNEKIQKKDEEIKEKDEELKNRKELDDRNNVIEQKLKEYVEKYYFFEEIKSKINNSENIKKILSNDIGINVENDPIDIFYDVLDDFKKIDSYISKNMKKYNYEEYKELIDFIMLIVKRSGKFKIEENNDMMYDAEKYINIAEEHLERINQILMPIIIYKDKIYKGKVF